MDNINDQVFSDIKNTLIKGEFDKYLSSLKFNAKISKPNLIVYHAKNELVAKFIQTKYANIIKNSYEKITGIRPQILVTSKAKISAQTIIAQTAPKPISTILFESNTFENFVVGDSNRFAFSCAKSVAQNPGADYNPLFIYGPSGLGKTHLLQSIGNYCIRKNKSVIYISANTFTEEFIQNLKRETMDKFKEKYRNCDLLLVDDIQFLAGKSGVQQEFFHTYNDLKSKGAHIVMVSDKAPNFLRGIEERLLSRFESGIIADITPPELETKIAIINQKLNRENINLKREEIEYIAINLGGNIRQIDGIVSEIAFYSKKLQMVPSMSLISSVLKNRIGEDKKEISIENVIDVVTKELNIKKSDLKSKKRTKVIADARRVAIYLSKELTNSSLAMIASAFNLKDHSAVSHNIKKQNEILEGSEFENTKIEELKNKIKKEKSE